MMKNSTHHTTLASISARAAFHFTTAVLLLAALPQAARAQTPALTVTILHDFNLTDGESPDRGLLQASDGDFYGTTPTGGTSVLGQSPGFGTVFRITPTGTFTDLVNFAGTNGQNPECVLIQGSDGLLYGTTENGGPLATDNGTIFKMTTAGVLQTLFAFPQTIGGPLNGAYLNGRFPLAALVQGNDGQFYGTNITEGMRSETGGLGNGTVFKISSAGAFQTLFTFQSSNVPPNFEGQDPEAPLVLDADGSFYSTTRQGGEIGLGTIFRITASGVKTELFEFTNATGRPEGGLVLGPDNKYYGTTESGGSSNLGIYYRISHAGVFETLGNFTGAANGGQPFGEMVLASDGNLYGTTSSGGSGSQGTIFRLNTAGVLTTVFNFPNDNTLAGSTPRGTLIQGSDGNLYGTTLGGGANNRGVIFRLNLIPLPTLLNISTRLDVLTGDNVLIAGFIITGNDPKQVIIRGLGPSLGGAGLQSPLADPVLELHFPDGTVVTNDNWKDTQKAAIMASIPPTNDLEAAIIETLPPGAYTAILRGKNSATGVGLVEAYDLDTAADSQLANISTRGFVDTGDNVLIGGFIIGGPEGVDSTVVVRAIGPSLAGAVGSPVLADPNLELHDSDGNILATNDNWKDGPDMSTIMADGLAPTNTKESALLANLPPGAYTAVVRGGNTGTGVGLIEIYNLQ